MEAKRPMLRRPSAGDRAAMDLWRQQILDTRALSPPADNKCYWYEPLDEVALSELLSVMCGKKPQDVVIDKVLGSYTLRIPITMAKLKELIDNTGGVFPTVERFFNNYLQRESGPTRDFLILDAYTIPEDGYYSLSIREMERNAAEANPGRPWHSYQRYFIPIGHLGHAFLGVVDRTRGAIYILDSYATPADLRYRHRIRKLMEGMLEAFQKLWNNMHGESASSYFMTFKTVTDHQICPFLFGGKVRWDSSGLCPQQGMTDHCGLFQMVFMECLARNLRFDFTVALMPYMRLRVALLLYQKYHLRLGFDSGVSHFFHSPRSG